MVGIPWVHLVGAYLLLGSLISGLGLIARIRWLDHDKPLFPHTKAKVWFAIGIVLGVFFWPVALLGIAAARRYLVRWKVNKILGHCEHATPFDPFCKACGRELKYQASGRRTPTEARKMYREIERKLREEEYPPPVYPPGPVYSSYQCSKCEGLFPGFPPHADAQRKPLCENCNLEKHDG